MLDFLRKIWVIIVVLIALIILAAIRIGVITYKGPPEKLIIADGQQIAFSLIYIAEAKGYFKDEGLDVTFRKFSLGRDALDDLIKRNSNLAVAYEYPYLVRLSQGYDLSAISSLHSSNKGSAVLVKKDKKISKPADFRGKKIGVTKGTNAEYLLSVMLSNEGIKRNEVKIFDLGYDELLRQYEAGKLDAIVIWNISQHLRNEKIASISNVIYSDTYDEISVTVGMTEYIKSHPSIIEKYSRAIIRARNFYYENPVETYSIVAQRLQLQDSKSVESTLKDIKLRVRLDNTLLAVFTQQYEWMKLNGIAATSSVNIRDHIWTKNLYNVDPTKVTIY